ncbi:MAG: hypothetical protein R3F11_19160 [Verrucomicrobiales bacterium]
MKRIKSMFLPFAAAGAALSLASCIDSDEKVMLNPDGSGKSLVKIKIAGGGPLGFGGAGEKPNLDEMAKQTAMGLLGGASGVEAWSDVKYEVNDEGMTEFSGIAYFPDITKYSVGSMSGGGMTMEGGEKGWTMKKEGDTVTLSFSPMGAAEEAKPGEPPADIDAEIKKARAEFQQGKAMMAGILGGFKTAVSLKVGGEITAAEAFKKTDSNVASMAFTGTDLLNGMEKAMMDDELMRKLAAKGQLGDQSGEAPPPEILEKIYGAKEVKVAFKAGDPLFDYKAEVAKVKANMPADLKKMIEDAKAAAADQGGALDIPGDIK